MGTASARSRHCDRRRWGPRAPDRGTVIARSHAPSRCRRGPQAPDRETASGRSHAPSRCRGGPQALDRGRTRSGERYTERCRWRSSSRDRTTCGQASAPARCGLAGAHAPRNGSPWVAQRRPRRRPPRPGRTARSVPRPRRTPTASRNLSLYAWRSGSPCQSCPPRALPDAPPSISARSAAARSQAGFAPALHEPSYSAAARAASRGMPRPCSSMIARL